MNEIFFRNITVYELDFDDNYLGVIDIQTSDDNDMLRGDVIIEDRKTDSKLVIGTCMSRDSRTSVEEIKAYCLNLLSNKSYIQSTIEHISEV